MHTYKGHQPSYTDNGDGTVTDNVTGLMWQQSLDHNNNRGEIDYADKLTYDDIYGTPKYSNHRRLYKLEGYPL